MLAAASALRLGISGNKHSGRPHALGHDADPATDGDEAERHGTRAGGRRPPGPDVLELVVDEGRVKDLVPGAPVRQVDLREPFGQLLAQALR
jgi:hypothetical protein